MCWGDSILFEVEVSMGSKMSARCASEPSAGGLAPLPDITARKDSN